MVRTVKPLSKELKDIHWKNLWGYKGVDRYMLLTISISVIIAVSILIVYLKDPMIWTVDSAPDEVINQRQKDRGMVTSIITSTFSMLASIIMIIGIKSDSAMYQTLVNILCVGIVGFIFDNAFATENGVRILLHGINNDQSEGSLRTASDAVQFSFGSLLSPKLARYTIVTMLDIFISLMLTDSIVWALYKKAGVDLGLSDIFAIIVVSITTFLAYANATRLEWAYPAVDEFHERSGLIHTSTILISSVLAGMIFIIWKPTVSKPIGIKSPGGKLIMVLILFMFIVGSYYGGFLTPILKYEIKRGITRCSGEPEDSTKRCIVSDVYYTETTTPKDFYDLGIYGLLGFFVLTVLCVFFTTAMGNNKFDIKRLTFTNVMLSLVVIGVLNIPGLIAVY